MSIVSAAAVPVSSADIERLSIISSTPVDSNDEPGRGSIYQPSTLAGGHLIHTHRTESEDIYLAAFATSWRGATADSSTPGAVTAKTILTRPTFYWVRDGASTPVFDRNGAPGYMYPRSDNLTLIDGTSDGGMAYYLTVLDGTPLVLSYRVGAGVTYFLGSGWMPNSIPTLGGVDQEQISWNKGLTSHGGNLYTFGERPSDRALFCRKDRSGATMYLSAKGWTPDSRLLAPMKRSDGSLLTSLGPVSVVTHHDQWYISVTSKPSTSIIVSFARTRHPLAPWQTLPKTLNLGSVAPAATTGAHFQTSVAVNPAFPSLVSTTESAGGLPLCYSIESSTAIRTAWDVLPVPRRPA